MLSDFEKAQVKSALGYLDLPLAPTLSLGLPRLIQPLFLVEQAMMHTTPESENLIRKWLAIIDQLEQQLVESAERAQVEKIGEITVNAKEPERILWLRKYWASRIADILGVPKQWYSLAGQQESAGPHSVPIRLG